MKLKELGVRLSNWAKKERGARERRSKVLNNRLLNLSAKDIRDEVLAKMTEIRLEMNLEADREELYWEQRARGINENLRKEFQALEILEAIKSIALLKASGIDGFPAVFFQKYWNIVGEDVTRYCLQVLNGQRSMEEVNQTSIVLIPKYTMVTNGKNGEEFQPARGLRQRDPLSPYLFLICAKGFSRILDKEKRERRIFGARISRSNISITHLFFADNNVLFGEASTEGANQMKTIINVYEGISGQQVNFNKSLISLSGNVEREVQERVGGILGVLISNNPERYLGLPTMVGRRKKQAFSEMKDRFAKLINNWSVRVLSYGEKEGGLGFKNLSMFNTALLEKQGWKIITQSDCLFARHLGSPTTTGRGDWLENQEWSGCQYMGVNIWNDAWILGAGNGRVQCQQIDIRHSKVSNLIDRDSVTWKQEKIQSLFGEEQTQRIIAIPLANSESQDALVWRGDNTGVYTAKNGYKWSNTIEVSNIQQNPLAKFYKRLWVIKVPSKIRVHLWRVAKEYVPVLYNLRIRKLVNNTLCQVCKKEEETRRYLNILPKRSAQKEPFFYGLFGITETKCIMRDPPRGDRIKINFDAAFNKSQHKSVSGIIARNNDGEVMASCTYPGVNMADPTTAEARACLQAVNMAEELGFQEVDVEGDALTVIRKINLESEYRSYIRGYIQEIKRKAGSFRSIKFLHIQREANRVAHRLAKEGWKFDDPQNWMEEVPSEMEDLVNRDRNSNNGR
ncbi:hypothetical protein CXB51_035829 [Gossypium anomalum]|uniref:Reverse transcriptase n=1 Tax=Gossypium anomalum TaxID=47600 RepID=A0A8J5Y9U9_9ROSI|nr:hypothetical protein CXB51_035829 [Gossypium anomalum]